MSRLVGYTFAEDVGGDTVLTRKISRIIDAAETPYQRYTIWESPTQGVCVTIDADLQSTGMDRPTYHEALVHPAMLLQGNPKNVLVCGGGEGVTIREALRYPAVENVVMVDIDRIFVEACRRHLPWWHGRAFEDPRLQLLHEDIFDFIPRCRTRFDVIVCDLTDLVEEVAPGRSFHSPEFYGSLQALLAPGGVLCTQASALSLLDFDNHVHILHAVQTRFRSALSYRAHHDSFFAPWSFVVAADRTLPNPAALPALFAEGFETHDLDLIHFDPPSLASCFVLNRRIREKVTAAI